MSSWRSWKGAIEVEEEVEGDEYPARDDTSSDESEDTPDDRVRPPDITGSGVSTLDTFANPLGHIFVGGGSHQPPTPAQSSPAPSIYLPSPTVESRVRSNLSNSSEAFQGHLRFFQDANTSSATSESAAALQEQLQTYTNAPLFIAGVSTFMNSHLLVGGGRTTLMPQYGLMGIKETKVDETSSYSVSSARQTNDALYRRLDPAQQSESEEERLVYANLNVPWSAFICGSQGAGKSHTLSCLLESSLVRGNDAGKLPKPLTGMVMHYDNFTSATSTQLCEAAYLCSSGIPVTILVSPANIWAMKKAYSQMPGLPADAPRPKVLPLYLAESQLDISRILKLMSIDQSAESVPLYMDVVINLLRDMAMEGTSSGGFSYTEFRRRLDNTKWVQGQMVPLNMRLKLLESFLRPSALTQTTRPAAAKEDIWDFKPGSLTIIDLSDPFVSSNDACSLFEICLSIFLEGRSTCGRVVALDEAHKFLLQSGEARMLTRRLTSIIREQRHTGTRVLIATQEPTLAPELIDLANVTFVHRFLSPAWYDVLKKHLAGAKKQDSVNKDALFESIVRLKTGEALVFSPTSLMALERDQAGKTITKPLGNGYFKVSIRSRLTADGGKSILASDAVETASTRITVDVPMHIVTKPPPQPRKQHTPPSHRGPGFNNDLPNTARNAPQAPAAQTAAPRVQPINDRIEREMRRLVRQRFTHGHRVYATLTADDKNGVYRTVERNCQVVTGTVINAASRPRWMALHRSIIAMCRAEKQMPPEAI